MSPIDVADLWADAERAGVLESLDSVHAGEKEDCDEDCWGQSSLIREAEIAATSMIRMDDGDIHLCDSSCPYAVLGKDGDLVCPFSGRVISHMASERTDYSTGRSTWSADPDMHGGSANGNMGWRKKVDRVTASKQAHRLSEQINDTVMPTAKVYQSKSVLVKRGALCVDETADPNASQKKLRVSKKHVESNDHIASMVSEAASIFTKLMSAKKRPSSLPPTPASSTSKLTDAASLSESAIKKYAKECIANQTLPLLDDVHNILIAVDGIVRREKEKEDSARARSASIFRNVRFREIASRLAVSLWRGACSTPYMNKIRKGGGGDSFRPFCVGVFYSMKRGLALSDGTVLVPSFSGFQDAFPTQREISSHSLTKALHASSHRGLCSIHRSLASLELDKQLAVFAASIRLVSELEQIA